MDLAIVLNRLPTSDHPFGRSATVLISIFFLFPSSFLAGRHTCLGAQSISAPDILPSVRAP